MWSKRMLCRKVLEDNDALLIISVEFGALFYHHWTGSYWGMNFEQRQRPIPQHAPTDSDLTLLTQAPKFARL